MRANVTLNGSPGGGTFSGPGVSGNSFDPGNAGTGTHTITYTVTVNGCTDSDNTTITVNAVPTADAGTYPAVCVNGANVTLNGSPSGGTFSGPGVSGNSFDPGAAGTGTHTITYSVTVNGCTDTDNTTITVNAVPNADAGTYPAVCVNAPNVTLNGSPGGGTFSGPGVSGNSFDPGAAGTGTHTITYSVTVNGCTDTDNATITVNAVPTADAGNYPAVCVNAPNVTLNGSPGGGTFSGPGVSGNSFDPAAAGTGTHTITYSVTVNGCTDTDNATITVNAVPTADAGNYPAVCVNAPSVTLNGSPGGGTFSGPGVSGNSFDPAAAGTGTHTITYSVTVNGCTDTDNATITVNSIPPAPTASSNSPVCLGGTLNLFASNIAGATYSWTGPNNFSVQNPTVTNVDAGDAGTYSVTATVNGCTSAAATTTVVLGAALDPGAINTTGGTFCVNWSATINSTAPATGQGLVYLWQRSDGCTGSWIAALGTNNNVNYTPPNFPSPGTYCYRRLVTDACGNSEFTATATYTIVADLTSQTVNPTPNVAAVCAGISVSATFSGGGGGAPGLFVDVYEFSTNSGTSWNAYTPGNAVSTVGLTGTNVVRIRTRREATGVAGCNFGAYNTYSWTVNAVPATPVPGNNGPLCAGQTLNLTSGYTHVTGSTYSWSGPNTFGSGVPNPSLANAQPSASGTYTLIVTLNGCTSTGSTTVTVNANPATPTITAGGPTTFCTGGNVVLTSSSATGNQWFLNGNPIAGATSQNYTATAAGSYTVTVTGVGGCVATSAATTVTVNTAPAAPNISADSPTTFCEGQTAILSDPSATGTLQWFFNGSPVSGATLNNLAALASGTYFLQASNGTCTTNSNSITVTVQPAPTINISGPTNVCVGSTINLSASPGGGSWSSSNSGIASVSGGAVTGVAGGGASISYTTTGGNGCTGTGFYPINVTTLPVVTAAATSTTICVGQSTSLSSTVTPPSSATSQTFCNGADDGFLNNANLPANWAQTSINATGLPATMGQITGVSVQISITHPTDNEVEIYLIAPWGTLNNNPGNAAAPNANTQTFNNFGDGIVLSTDNGGTGNNYTNTIFSSAGGPGVGGGAAPFNGTYSPEESFGNLPAGNNPNGNWTIRVVDDTNSGDVGTLTNWCITFTYGSGYTYQWTSSPAGFTSAVEDPGTVAPTVTTTYTITTTSTGTGCSGTAQVTVNVITPPSIVLGANPTVCQSTTTAPLPYSSPVGSPDQYSIDYNAAANAAGFADFGFIALPGSPIILTVPAGAAPATYNGTLTVRNSAGGCNGAAIPFSVTVTPGATVVAGPTITACQSATPAAITLAGASFGGSATSAAWSITNLNPANGGNDGTLSSTAQTGTPATVTYTPPANYTGTVTLTLTTNAPGGCPAASQTRQIIISPQPTVTPGPALAACQSATPVAITLTGASVGGGAATGAWSITSGGGVLSSTAQTATPATVTYTPAAGFTGTVTLTLTTDDPAGPCGPISATRTINVSPAPTAVAGGPNTVCQSATPAAITLTGASIGGSATTGAWSITSGGGSLSSTAQTTDPASVTYTPAAGFSGVVTLTLND